jgi:D-3-phosphoglycerate dehydrogenase
MANSPLRIALLDDTLGLIGRLPSFAMLRGHRTCLIGEHLTDPEQLAVQVGAAEVLVLTRERTPITASLLARLPNLQMISQISDTPHIDLEACTRRGVLVSANRFPGAPHFRALHATAELTWALILMANRRLPEEMRAMREGLWHRGAGRSVRGRTLGLFGYGRISTVVAGFGKAFGMRVVVWGSERSRARALADGHEACVSQREFFETADVLSLHLRLNDGTRHIVTSMDLARMKPDSVLVNTSRAALIEPGALLAALYAGQIGMAAVDVFEDEPVTDPSHPVLRHDRLICTPHIGYVERDSLDDQYAEIYQQIFAWERGEPVHVVNPDVLSRNHGPRARNPAS